MKKFTAYLFALLCMAAFTACSSGAGESGPDYNSPDYGQLTITHLIKNLTKHPSFTSDEEITGMISWSDALESEEWDATTTHQYEGAAPYQVTYDLWKAKTVTISDMTNISEIDFSKF